MSAGAGGAGAGAQLLLALLLGLGVPTLKPRPGDARMGRHMRDLERLAARYELPFRKPSGFPRSSLLAARVALVGVEEGWVASFSRAVMQANFAVDRDIGERAVIADILSAQGLDADAVIERAQADANKLALRRQTERATELGLFGAPSFRVGDELFWGNGRLDDALAWARSHGASQ